MTLTPFNTQSLLRADCERGPHVEIDITTAWSARVVPTRISKQVCMTNYGVFKTIESLLHILSITFQDPAISMTKL